MRKTLAAALATAALLGTAACGGSNDKDTTASSDRPTVEQLTAALKGTVKDAKTATCVATVMHDSKLSDAALKAVAEKKQNYTESAADKKVLNDLTTQMAAKCVTSSNTSN